MTISTSFVGSLLRSSQESLFGQVGRRQLHPKVLNDGSHVVSTNVHYIA